MPSLVVLGTGAMGSLLAARLARGGAASVRLAGTWPAALAAIAERGVWVEEGGESWSVPVPTVTLSAAAGPVDYAIVAVKSHQTAAVAPVAARLVAGQGLVVTLQNGLGNLELLEAAAGLGRVATGAATFGATLLAPGRVRAVPGDLVLGFSPSTAPAVEALAGVFERAGVPARTSPDIDALLWRKLAVNCAINPLSALLRVPNGKLLATPERRARMAEAAREVAAVAAALGHPLDVDPVALAEQVATQTATNRSSMLQDLDRGRPTEIDAMCGAVVREARRLGVAIPVNDSLWQQVREREAQAVPAPRGASA